MGCLKFNKKNKTKKTPKASVYSLGKHLSCFAIINIDAFKQTFVTDI